MTEQPESSLSELVRSADAAVKAAMYRARQDEKVVATRHLTGSTFTHDREITALLADASRTLDRVKFLLPLRDREG